MARKANESGGMEVLNKLFGAAYAPEKRCFTARGESPDINPCIAANPEYAGGQPMIRAFTDTNRLQQSCRSWLERIG